VDGAVHADEFIGDGSKLTGLPDGFTGSYTGEVNFIGDLSVSESVTVEDTLFVNNLELLGDTIELDGDVSVGGALFVQELRSYVADGTFAIDGHVSASGVLLAGQLGYIQGFELSYTSNTSVQITGGGINCYDKFCLSVGNIIHTVVNYSNGGYTYLYVSYSASSNDSIVFIDSTTAPTWSAILQGYYNGDDRCIGALYCDGAATISQFMLTSYGNYVRYELSPRISIASSMDPTQTWQIPDDFESSVKLPVNAIEVFIAITGADADNTAGVYATSYERATAFDTTTSGNTLFFLGREGTVGGVGWISLGETRNIRIAGINDDDNSLQALIVGYCIRR
jgi:hypothetical protein